MASNVFVALRGADQLASRVQDAINNVLAPVARALQSTPIMGAAPPAWIRPTLTGGYSQWAAPFAVVAYHRDCLGYVHVKGKTAHAVGTAAGASAFTLPIGYRPAETRCFAVEGTGGTFQSVHVSTAGLVTNAVAIAAGGSCDLEFSFLAER